MHCCTPAHACMQRKIILELFLTRQNAGLDTAKVVSTEDLLWKKEAFKNGRAVVYSDGSLVVDGVQVIVDGPNDQSAIIALREEIARASTAREQAIRDGNQFKEEDDDFIVRVRRGSTHINSYNWIIQQALRSNMDIKARVWRDSASFGYAFVYLQ